MAHLSDRELGIALAFQFQRRPDLPPQALQAMIQDLLSNDTSMRAPLRELTQSPIFLRARPLAGGVENLAKRDVLVAEIGAVFQPELIERVGQFLDAYLGLETRTSSSLPPSNFPLELSRDPTTQGPVSRINRPLNDRRSDIFDTASCDNLSDDQVVDCNDLVPARSIPSVIGPNDKITQVLIAKPWGFNSIYITCLFGARLGCLCGLVTAIWSTLLLVIPQYLPRLTSNERLIDLLFVGILLSCVYILECRLLLEILYSSRSHLPALLLSFPATTALVYIIVIYCSLVGDGLEGLYLVGLHFASMLFFVAYFSSQPVYAFLAKTNRRAYPYREKFLMLLVSSLIACLLVVDANYRLSSIPCYDDITLGFLGRTVLSECPQGSHAK